MILIGLSGKKRSGKNTVAKLIGTLTNLTIKEVAFADALKEEVSKACGITIKYLEEHKDNFRLILQGWGTDFRRGLQDDNYWTSKVEHDILLAANTGTDICIVTDVRFVNEYNCLNKLGAVLIRVDRPSQSTDQHVSETSLDKVNNWHFIILN